MEALYFLIRPLRIDARDIFNPEMATESPAIEQLRMFVDQCSEHEVEVILPILRVALTAIRKTNKYEIK